jgi:hypothetical protein
MKRIEVRVSEILEHLRDSGQFREALNAIVAQRTGGQDDVEVTVVPDLAPAGELSDADLAKVAGGASAVVAGPKVVAIDKDKLQKIPAGKLPPGGLPAGFADTTW